jgi:hypothetical protein
MYYDKIPPVQAVDYKENFIQNFFDRLMDMKISSVSESLKTFLDDSVFLKMKKKEVSNIDSMVS